VQVIIVGINSLARPKKVLILKCLVEGMSLRSTARIADVSRNTVAKLLADAGKACSDYQDLTLRSPPCKRIQCDEIWAFVYAKQNTLPRSEAVATEKLQATNFKVSHYQLEGSASV